MKIMMLGIHPDSRMTVILMETMMTTAIMDPAMNRDPLVVIQRIAVVRSKRLRKLSDGDDGNGAPPKIAREVIPRGIFLSLL